MKRRETVRQRRSRAAQSKQEPRALNRPALDISRAGYLGIDQLMEYLPIFPTQDAAREWIRRNAIPSFRSGRNGGGKVIVRRRDIDLALEESRESHAR